MQLAKSTLPLLKAINPPRYDVELTYPEKVHNVKVIFPLLIPTKPPTWSYDVIVA